MRWARGRTATPASRLRRRRAPPPLRRLLLLPHPHGMVQALVQQLDAVSRVKEARFGQATVHLQTQRPHRRVQRTPLRLQRALPVQAPAWRRHRRPDIESPRGVEILHLLRPDQKVCSPMPAERAPARLLHRPPGRPPPRHTGDPRGPIGAARAQVVPMNLAPVSHSAQPPIAAVSCPLSMMTPRHAARPRRRQHQSERQAPSPPAGTQASHPARLRSTALRGCDGGSQQGAERRSLGRGPRARAAAPGRRRGEGHLTPANVPSKK